MWVERELSGELQSLARTFPIVVLTGPRQVGWDLEAGAKKRLR